MVNMLAILLLATLLAVSGVKALPSNTTSIPFQEQVAVGGRCTSPDKPHCADWYKEFGLEGKYSNYSITTTEHKLEGRDDKYIDIHTIVDLSDVIDVGNLNLDWVISRSWDTWWKTGVNSNFNGAQGFIKTDCKAPLESDMTHGNFWIGGEWADQARDIDGWQLGKILIGGALVSLKSASQNKNYGVTGGMQCTAATCWMCPCQPKCEWLTATKVPKKMRVVARDRNNWGAQVGEIVIEFKDWWRYDGICGLNNKVWKDINSLNGIVGDWGVAPKRPFSVTIMTNVNVGNLDINLTSDIIDVGNLDLGWVISPSKDTWWKTGVNTNDQTGLRGTRGIGLHSGNFWICGEWADQARDIDGWELGKILIGGALRSAAQNKYYGVTGPMRCTGMHWWTMLGVSL
ncbi:hypothetical protein HDU97_008796 [Phlyctochytrium planicorne]|nr:hypothetical protein HDU97_008796 [Phlyctochytrium planicorne]